MSFCRNFQEHYSIFLITMQQKVSTKQNLLKHWKLTLGKFCFAMNNIDELKSNIYLPIMHTYMYLLKNQKICFQWKKIYPYHIRKKKRYFWNDWQCSQYLLWWRLAFSKFRLKILFIHFIFQNNMYYFIIFPNFSMMNLKELSVAEALVEICSS